MSISNAADVDYYSFTVNSAASLSATLTPRGGVFSQGSADQNQTPTSFDANSRSNLALTIYSTDGTTVLSLANSNPAGVAETISNLLLPSAGKYYAKITGADDTIQMYELALTATSMLPGDYNHNGVVDAADYIVWRNSLGQSIAAGTGADGNGDGLDHSSRLRPVAVPFWADRKRQRLRARLWCGHRSGARARDI